jgi:hypothetical protein
VNSRPPDFDDLIGPEGDPAERDRLRRVHDLLVASGPPPELSSETPPATAPVALAPRRRRRGVLLALAAAFGVAAFTIGLVAAQGDDATPDRVIAMSGPSGESASLEIFDVDEAGNWPMLIDVEGLAPLPRGRLYQLWLTKGGELTALCGSFLANPDGRTVVPMNAPWRLDDFDGWVVVEAGSKTPLLTT